MVVCVKDKHPASDIAGRQSEDQGVCALSLKRKRFLCEDEEEERPVVKKGRGMCDNNDSDGSVRGMTTEEKQEKDLDQQTSQRRCLGALSPGDPALCARARVPMPSSKLYVVRPKWNRQVPMKDGMARLKNIACRLAAIRRQAMKCQAVRVSVNGNRL